MPPAASGIDEAVRVLAGRRRILALTGAGVSTESGLPDFRSSTGLFRDRRAEEVLSLSFFERQPDDFWAFYRERLLVLHAARPNPAHRALATLEAAGLVSAVVTQNIDGLHQAAGSRRVRELHGSVRLLRCDCGHVSPTAAVLPDVARGAVPRCPSCGGPERPAVVLFGEPLDAWTWSEAERDVWSCDALLVVGSSLQVAPANELPWLALSLGRPVVVLDRQPTDIDVRSTVLRGDAGRLLPVLADRLEARAAASQAPRSEL